MLVPLIILVLGGLLPWWLHRTRRLEAQERRMRLRDQRLALARLAGTAPPPPQAGAPLGEAMVLVSGLSSIRILRTIGMGCLGFWLGSMLLGVLGMGVLHLLADRGELVAEIFWLFALMAIPFISVGAFFVGKAIRRRGSPPLEFFYHGVRMGNREVLYRDLYEFNVPVTITASLPNGSGKVEILLQPWDGAPIAWEGRGQYSDPAVGRELRDWIRTEMATGVEDQGQL